MNKTGFLAFHQGWTDIANSLALINYYAAKTDNLFVVMRSDAKPFVSYYVKDLTNVVMLYEAKELIDRLASGGIYSYFNDVSEKNKLSNIELYMHGIWDRFRVDHYKNRFVGYRPECHYVQDFYEQYGIDFMEKVNCFQLERNHELENHIYDEFTKKYGDDYVLIHDSAEMNLNVQGVQLAGLAKNPFEYCKVLQNAKEIHLIDSFWATIIYQLDAKYKMFKDKQINIYPFKPFNGQVRGGGLFILPTLNKLKPVELENWCIQL